MVLIWFVDAQERNTPNYWSYMARFRHSSVIGTYDPTSFYMFEYSSDLMDAEDELIKQAILESKEWCAENLSGPYVFDGITVTIKNPNDIMAFKLRWC